MPLPSDVYWHYRLKERFREAYGVETEIARLYASEYEKILKSFLALIDPYYNSDGSIDFPRLQTDLKMENQFSNTFKRYRALLSRLDGVENTLRNQEILSIEQLIMKTYQDNYYRVLYALEKAFGKQINFALLSPERLQQVMKTSWSKDGKEFSSRIWDNKKQLTQELRTLITDGIATGKSPLQVAQALQDATNNTLYNSKRIIRTETMAIITDSDAAAFEEAGIEKYRILSTFDKRTSRICQQQDGKEYLLKEKKIATNAPPFHPNCRTTIVPVMPNPTQLRFARNADGRPIKVPLNMSYEEFKQKHLIPTGEK